MAIEKAKKEAPSKESDDEGSGNHGEAQGRVMPREHGSAGNALVVPGLKRDELRRNKSDTSKAISKDMKSLDGINNELHAQEDLSAAAALMQSGQLLDALAAFQRAESLHGGDAIALSARAGEATVLSRLDRCGESIAIARRVGQQAPRFGGRAAMLREVANCFDRRRDGVTALALRKEADEAAMLASHGGDQQEAVARALKRDELGLQTCQRTATAAGELPKADGTWTVSVVVDASGKVQSARARGPAAAPGLQRCLEDMAKNTLVPTLSATTSVDVPLGVHAQAAGGAPSAAPVRARKASPPADADTQAR